MTMEIPKMAEVEDNTAMMESAGYNELKMDALKEIGNIGASHAANVLTRMVEAQVLISVTGFNIIKVEDLPTSLGMATDEVSAVYVDVASKHDGSSMMMMLPYEESRSLANLFFPMASEEGMDEEMRDEAERSAICEVGNICICAYLNAISQFVDLPLVPSPPGLAVDMRAAILEFPAALIAEHSSYAVVIHTKFIHKGQSFSGFILFMPEPHSQEHIFKHLGLDELLEMLKEEEEAERKMKLKENEMK